MRPATMRSLPSLAALTIATLLVLGLPARAGSPAGPAGPTETAAGSVLVAWNPPSGTAASGEAGWTPLHSTARGTIGLLPAGSAALASPGVQALEPYRDPDLYLFLPLSQLRALARGELPPTWRTSLPNAADLARTVRLLYDDGAVALVKVPAELREAASNPGCRTMRLPTPAEASAARAQQGSFLERGASGDPERTQPAEYWQALAKAVDSDRCYQDLGYLSTTLQTRYYSTSQMESACQYVYNRFNALGLTTSYDAFTYNGHPIKNVLGVKMGTVDPNRIIVVLGHLDSTSPDPQHVAPGADDNGSGSVAVLEAARLLASVPTDYTIYFLCVTAEEQGLIGSEHFAALAQQRHLDIRGVLALDMVSYQDPAGADLWIEGFHYGVSSVWLLNQVESVAETYCGLSVYQYPGEGFGSDHVPFHDHGYSAILSIENEWDSYPCYHRTCDTVEWVNSWLWRGITGANVITAGQLAQAQGAVGTITGTVACGDGGDPSGARVRIPGTGYPELVCGSTRTFAWNPVFPGTYDIIAEKTGYQSATGTLQVASGGTASINLTLESMQPGAIAGTVRFADGQPAGGARIKVEGQEFTVFTAADGTYVLNGVLPGNRNLCASKGSLMPSSATVALGAGQTLNGIDFVLEQEWDFETAGEGLTPTGSWGWGTDAVAGAHSGVKVWGTALGSDYADCADDRLALAPISLEGYQSVALHLWMWGRTQSGVDGGNLQASTDGGATWVVVPAAGGYGGSLGGNCNPLAGQSGVSGITDGWVEKTFALDAFLNRWVRLRFAFGSDAATHDRGWYIDDLSLQAIPVPLSVDEEGADLGARASLHASPVPARGPVALTLRLRDAGSGALSIFGPDGRRVARVLPLSNLAAGSHQAVWDGRDDAGRTVPSGIYWARWEGARERAAEPIVILR